jgi:AbiV family abortive infection protein
MAKLIKKLDYFEIYKKAHKNAIELLKEAKILFEKECYSRAYFLAFTALEEISKSQFAADVYTSFSKEEDFLSFYRNHKDKIKRINWAHYDANSYPHNTIWIGPDRDDVEIIEASKPLFKKRNNSLYVGIENTKIILPDEEIKEKDVKEIIHIADVAFERIWEVTEYWGNNIGTKGFMK